MIKADGVNAFFLNWEERIVSGWCRGIKAGDKMTATMQSGKSAVFEFVEVDYKTNPPDQYFSKVKDIGYQDE